MTGPVKMNLRLGLDFSAAGQEGSPLRKSFQDRLGLDLAEATGADPGSGLGVWCVCAGCSAYGCVGVGVCVGHVSALRESGGWFSEWSVGG